MEILKDCAVRLTAVCALSAVVELLLPEGAKKKGVRLLAGLLTMGTIVRAALEALAMWE
ncbi:MAG TPA: hypothetical protein IAB02_09570 [Candidatus Pullichristensenella excrementigallinarum]|uniref:Uncharacterized protein n=1 Tax=Candidatus Pullichristensenella excrementigallinarum TaxID=2840907 RepID=A0A9D1ID82_9FIRM|nr:hypothetical protein [Candidatus Pullichristensenella excrementigallinarum]